MKVSKRAVALTGAALVAVLSGGFLFGPQHALAETSTFEAIVADGEAVTLATTEPETRTTSSVGGAGINSGLGYSVRVTGTESYDYAQQVVDLVNQERAKVGVSPVTMDAELTEAAMQRAAECSLYFSHTRPNGTLCFTISSRMHGENIAAGSSTPAGVMNQWINSAGHYANIIDRDWDSIGIGCFRVGAVTYWVQAFSASSASGSVSGGNHTATATIEASLGTVPYEGSGFNLDMPQADPEPLSMGETYELVVGILNPGWNGAYCPTDASGYTWVSSDPSVVSVGADGVVRAGSKAGTATVTATSAEGHSWSKTFQVMEQPAGETVTMWRLYNPRSGEHLFTAYTDEYDHLGSIGWIQEGAAWMAPANGEPVYRLYNPYTGDHHYTMDGAEYDQLAALGWVQEGVGFRSAPEGSGVTVYRLYNPYATTGTHHYTTDRSEYDYLGTIGWRQEGVAWYGLS